MLNTLQYRRHLIRLDCICCILTSCFYVCGIFLAGWTRSCVCPTYFRMERWGFWISYLILLKTSIGAFYGKITVPSKSVLLSFIYLHSDAMTNFGGSRKRTKREDSILIVSVKLVMYSMQGRQFGLKMLCVSWVLVWKLDLLWSVFHLSLVTDTNQSIIIKTNNITVI